MFLGRSGQNSAFVSIVGMVAGVNIMTYFTQSINFSSLQSEETAAAAVRRTDCFIAVSSDCDLDTFGQDSRSLPKNAEDKSTVTWLQEAIVGLFEIRANKCRG